MCVFFPLAWIYLSLFQTATNFAATVEWHSLSSLGSQSVSAFFYSKTMLPETVHCQQLSEFEEFYWIVFW